MAFSVDEANSREFARGIRLKDSNWWKRGVYFFELILPSTIIAQDADFAGVGDRSTPGTLSFIYPLVLNPESVEIVDRFTKELSPGHDGGLSIEENGILMKDLRIAGTFGQRPKYLAARPPPVSLPNMSFDYRAQSTFAADNYSGQRLFEFLQDNVFRTYGEVKRNRGLTLTDAAKQTQLIFHDSRNDQHWVIIPESFAGTQQAGRVALERYVIQATIVDRARPYDLRQARKSRQANVWDKINDAVRVVRSVINRLKAFVQFVQAAVNTVKATIANVVSLVNDAVALVNALGNLINTPFAVATALTDAVASSARAFLTEVDNAIATYATSANVTDDIIVAQFRSVADASELLLLTLRSVGADNVRNERDRLRRTAIGSSRSSRELTAASAITSVSAQGLASYGSGPLPGEQFSAEAELFRPPTSSDYANVRTYIIQEGDTLEGIARRMLGDGSRARQIADLNGLRYPYVTTYGAPNTVRPGQPIRVPGQNVNADVTFVPGIFTAVTDEADLRVCGRDWETQPSSTRIGFTELVINGDRNDARAVEGIANLTQGLELRMSFARGDDPLFPDLGVDAVIGTPVAAVALSLVELRTRDAITADPRISAVNTEQLVEDDAGTAVSLELSATITSVNRTISLSAPVGVGASAGA